MADSSFDVVSKVDRQEVDNALDQAAKELATRFDFRGTDTKIEWQGEPKPADLGKDGKHLYGWLVEFRVNSRNRFGQYTGKQSHGVLIRDDRVIKGTGFGYGE